MAPLLKLDENIPPSLATMLSRHGYECATVHQQGWGGLDDEQLFPLICKEGRILITTDTAFADWCQFPPGSHPGIIVLVAKQMTPMTLRRNLQSLVTSVRLEDIAGCVVVACDENTLIRRPADAGREGNA
jgi:predicted nuclease of predicted toxin-antitoxin system